MHNEVFSVGFFPLLGIYLSAVNLLAAVLTVIDKRRAVRHAWRIPEKVLFLVALLGGSIGEYCTMRLIRHKTLHKRFMWGLPAMFMLQLALAGWAVHLMMTRM
ncbi:MAG: DUF1294 domain-containing protein [Clostridia bacterium]|nr:DUF1294 domain-containing protein [Clostridia bacterium]